MEAPILIFLFVDKNDNRSTGFASPAEDYLVEVLNLDDYVCAHRHETYFGRISKKVTDIPGFDVGDVLIINKAAKPAHDNFVIALVDGELVIRKLKLLQEKACLSPLSTGKVLDITADYETRIFGVITFVLKDARTVRID